MDGMWQLIYINLTILQVVAKTVKVDQTLTFFQPRPFHNYQNP